MIFERERVIFAGDRFIEDINNLPSEIKNNTIILIGPMGTGKSTIARLLAGKIENGYRLDVDNREQFEKLYKKEKRFNNFKNFEFTLIGTILSLLKRPCIIDFGAGHSIYEDPVLRGKMQAMCSQFKNIILLLPSKDNETSRRILLERRNIQPGSHKDKVNWHFITAPNNYELATDIIYEEEKSPQEISKEILELINQKNRNYNTGNQCGSGKKYKNCCEK